jgi:PAS domain S-box-containing protein
MATKKTRSPSQSGRKPAPKRVSARPVAGKVRRGPAAGAALPRKPGPSAVTAVKPWEPAPEMTPEYERGRMLKALENLPVYTVLLSKDYRVPFANRYFRERFGDSGGRRCHEYLFQRDTPCADCQSFIPFKTNQPHRWEWHGPDGRDYDIHDIPFTDVDGAEFVMETGIDITERKRAEAELSRMNADQELLIAQRTQELADSERRWSTTLASIGDAVIACDRDGRITFLNPAAEALTGWSRKAAEGTPVREVFRIINEQTRRPVEDPVAKVLATGGVVGPANHTLLIRKDGLEIAIDDSGAPIREPDGTIDGVVLVFRDITQRRAAEREISNLAKFPGENPNPVLRVNPQGALLFANESSRRLLGALFSESGTRIPEEWLDLVRRAFAAGRNEVAEWTAGANTWLVTAAPVAGEAYVNVYAVDISSRRKREADLARLNRTLKALSDSNQAMMRAKDEQGFMDSVCRIIVEGCGHAMVWIGFAEEDDARSVRPAAHFGFEDGYLETLKLTWADTERGRGPTGTAIRTGKPSLCRNMLTDPAFEPWRAEALRRGYASSIALPLAMDGRAVGAVTIYSRDPDPFSDEEVALLSELAGDLGYGIQAIRLRANRDELLARVEEQRWLSQQAADELGAIFASISDAVLVYDSGGRIRQANAAFPIIFGFNPLRLSTAEIRDRLNSRTLDGRPLDPAQSPTARALAGRTVVGERYLVTGPGDCERVVMASAVPLFENGRSSGAVTVMHDVTEQARTTEQLEEQRRLAQLAAAEARLRADELDAVINTIGDGVMIHGPQGELVRMNPAAEKMMGYTPEDMRLPCAERFSQTVRFETADGRPITDPDSLPIANALRGTAVHGEMLGLRHLQTGKLTWATVTAAPLRAADGTINGAVSSLTDITERKQAEERLADQANLLANITDVVYSTDEQLRLTSWNHAAEKAYGWSAAEVLGKSVVEVTGSKFDPETRRRLAGNLAETGSVTLEIEHVTRSGKPILFESKTIQMRGPDGKAAGFLAVNRDITGRKAAERALQASEAKANALIKYAPTGIYEIDYSGPRFKSVNDAMCQILGYTREELLALSPAELLDDESKARFADRIRRQMAGLKIEESVEYQVRKKDGSCLTAILKVTLDPAGGEPGTVLVIANDITDRKRMETALAENASELQTLLDSAPTAIWIAHDPECRRITGNAAADRILAAPRGGNISRSAPAGEETISYQVYRGDYELKPVELPVQLAAATGKPVPETEYRIDFPDGREVHVRMAAVPLFDVLGRVRGAVATGTDVTGLKRAESALKESEATLRGILTASQESIWLFSPDARILLGNPVAWGRLGRRPEETVGKHFREILPPALAELREARLNQAVASKQPVDFEDERGGIVFRHSFYPVLDGAGKVTSVACFSRDITADKRAETALRNSEARFRSVLDHSRDVIYRLHIPTNKFEYISPSAEAVVGFTPAELMALDSPQARAMIHPADLPGMEAAIARLEKTGSEEAEYRQKTKSGEDRWLSNHMSLIRDGAGRPLYRDGNIRDITEKKQAEEALRESEARFRLALRNAPVSVAAQDRELRFAWAFNQRTIPPELVVGKTDRDLFPADAEWLIELKRGVLATGNEIRKKVWLVSGGRRVYLDLLVEPIRDSAGEITGVGIATVDLTQMKLAEEELERQREELRVTLGSIGDGVIATDGEGRITFINPIAAELTGWGTEEAAGRPVAEIFRIMNEPRRTASEDIVARVQREKQIVTLANNTILIHRSGREVPIEDSAAPILDGGGAVLGVVLVFHDVSEKRRTQKTLQENVARLRLANDLLETVTAGTNVLIAAVDLDYRFTFFNRTYREEIGRLAAKEIEIGNSLLDVFGVQPDQQDVARAEWSEPLQGKTTSKTIEFGDPGTYRRYYNVRHTPIRDGAGRVIGAGEVAYDVTDQVLSERAVARASEDRRLALEAGALGTWEYVLAEGELILDARCRELFGIAGAARITLDDFSALIHSEDRERVIRAIRSAVAEEQAGDFHVSFRVPHTNGKQHWLDSFGRSYFEGEPGKARLVRFLGVIQDVTDRKTAEMEILGLARFPGENPNPILRVDGGMKILYANAASRKFGEDWDYRTGQPLMQPLIRVAEKAYRSSGIEEENVPISGKVFVISAVPFPGENYINLYGRDITENIRLLDEVGRQAAELDAVINSIGDGVMIHDAQGGLIRMNPAAEKMMGFTPEDKRLSFAERLSQVIRIEAADGRPVTDLDTLPMARALRGAKIHGEVLGLRHIRTGNLTWVDVTAEPLRAADGTVFGAVSSLTDITERKEMENNLRRNRDALETQVKERTRELEAANTYNRSLIEANLDPQVTISADGKIGDVNAATEVATGLPRKELIGTDFSDYFTDPEKARAGYQRVFAEGKVSDYELELRHRYGRIIPVLYNASVYTDESGAVKGVIAAARDITRRRQGEAQARENLRRVEVMAEISHLLAEAGLNYAAALGKIARTTAQLFGDECHIHLPAGDGRLHLEVRRKAEGGDSRPAAAGAFSIPDAVVERVYQTRQPLFLPVVSAGALQASAPPGSLASLAGTPLSALMIVPLQFQDQALGTIAVARYGSAGSPTPVDQGLLTSIAERLALAITNTNLYSDLKRSLGEEQKTRQQLVQSEKLAAMGRMLGAVAHELNNPLQTIKNCLYLVQQEIPANEEVKNFIDMASSETRRLVKLVAQLRELYRPGNTAAMQESDLEEILQEVAKLMQTQLEENRVQWRLESGAKPLTVTCDKERIEQVFINLTTNAIEAMRPEGGMLALRLVQSPDGRRNGVVFRDSGPGIPAEMIGNLFDPFVTTKSSGLGLGLSICYEIAQKHGGTLEVENPPGGGAQFTLWLPKTQAGGES